MTFDYNVLNQILIKKRTNANALSKKTGVPQPTIHKIIEGKTANPGINTLIALAKGLDVSLLALLGDEPIGKTNKCSCVAPLISWVKAGRLTEVEDQDIEEWYPYPGKSESTKIFCLRVEGESMEPKFYDCDIVFIDPEKAYDNGSIVIVVDNIQSDSFATMKKIVIDGSNCYLKPLNPDWPGPKYIPMTDTMTVVGVVVGKYVKE